MVKMNCWILVEICTFPQTEQIKGITPLFLCFVWGFPELSSIMNSFPHSSPPINHTVHAFHEYKWRIAYVKYSLFFWDVVWLFLVNLLQHSYFKLSLIDCTLSFSCESLLILQYECCNQFTSNSHTASQKTEEYFVFAILPLYPCSVCKKVSEAKF